MPRSAHPSRSEAAGPLIRVRRSKIHGSGVFALCAIPRGTRVIEYVGERVSHAEADRRYEGRPVNDAHTFLFIVDHRTVVVLHHYSGLPLGEIAEILGIPRGTVKSRLHHAVRALRGQEVDA